MCDGSEKFCYSVCEFFSFPGTHIGPCEVISEKIFWEIHVRDDSEKFVTIGIPLFVVQILFVQVDMHMGPCEAIS